jgi:hypothetical protein
MLSALVNDHNIEAVEDRMQSALDQLGGDGHG